MMRSTSDRVFDVAVHVVLAVVMALSVLPFINILAKSLSGGMYVQAQQVGFIPRGLTFEAYQVVLANMRFWRSFMVSVTITVVGTLLNTLLTVHVAYAVSRPQLRGRRLIGFAYIFTMFFNGGLIPTYLVVRAAGMINTIWSVIVPALVIPYHMIIVRNYFFGISSSIEESAKIDGASNVTILYRIYLPIAMPSVATIALFYAVDYWNQYFEALIYITERNLFPLQVFLREIIRQADPRVSMASATGSATASISSAAVLASTVPILLVYPFLQKYFVKGIMLGSVKE